MKHKYLLILAAIAAAAVSCNTKDAPVVMGEETATVQVQIRTAPLTKSDAPAFETDVKSFDLLVYDAESRRLLHREKTSSDASFMMKMIPGRKRVVAFANGDDVISGTASLPLMDDLGGLYYPFQIHNVSDNKLVMSDLSGFNESIDISEGANNVISVNLKRFPCRIRVHSITPAFHSVTVQQLSYGNAWLCNIPSRYALDGTLDDAAATRKNPVKSEITAANSFGGGLTFQALSTQTDGSYTLADAANLYCYPGSDVYLGFSANINNVTYYYALPVGPLASNTTYDVDILLHNLGSEDPDNPAINTGVSAQISVLPWESGQSVTETL